MVFCGYFEYKRVIEQKQLERRDKIAALTEYRKPLTPVDLDILSKPASEVVDLVHKGELVPLDVLKAYGKRALEAHAENNCITEILIEDAEEWAKKAANSKGPLAGFPISLKDTAGIIGYDSCMGYVNYCNKPFRRYSTIVQILLDAGAVPFVKTNVPHTLLSFESYNDVWGRTENPHVHGYSAGGSTGGEASLLSFGGSRLGIGTDVAGSVRIPSHFCGSYTVKCSSGRFPKAGNGTTMPGQDAIPSVYSPMTRTLGDLKFLLKAVLDMKPWDYDYSVHPIPWREVELPKKLTVGVLYDDGVIIPSPACARALESTVQSLKAQGHTVIPFQPPDLLKALRIASQLLCYEAGKICLRDKHPWEQTDFGVERMFKAQRYPRWVKKIWSWYLRYIKKDEVWATLIEGWNEKTSTEVWDLIAEREGFRAGFFDAWKESKIDVLITPPNATPAFPHNGLYESISSCGYTFLFNLLDYSAGILPVIKVDKKLDQLPKDFNFKKLNGVAKGAYMSYDADKMHGLPVGVQVVGRRLEEEKVIKVMEIIEDSLHKAGVDYPLLNA